MNISDVNNFKDVKNYIFNKKCIIDGNKDI